MIPDLKACVREIPPPPPAPPPRHTRTQNPAIIKLDHMGTHTPRQLPPSPTTPPNLRKGSGSSGHTWPRLRLIPMRKTIVLRQCQLQPRHTCIRRNPRPSRQSCHPVANLRWATYHIQRTWSASRPRVSAGTRPCSGDGRNLPLPHQHERERQHRHL